MTLGINISGGLQIVNPLDSLLLEVCVPLVLNHCRAILGIDAQFEGIIDGHYEVGPNGKTYTLKLKLKVRIGDAYVIKIVVVKFFWPFIGIPTNLLSFEYVEEINI